MPKKKGPLRRVNPGGIGDEEKNKMRQKLRSIGCAFPVHLPDEPADPERAILDSLKYWWDYNDFFFMCFSLLRLTPDIRGLINVERLITLAEDLSNDELILFLALSERMVWFGDERFEQAAKKLYKPNLQMDTVPLTEENAYLIAHWGVESSLEKYGVRVRAFYVEEERKFFPLKDVLANNEWLRVRSIVGPTYKADIAYFKVSGKAKTADEAQSLSGCPPIEASRYWEEIKGISSIDKLVA
jgi:hypothetical protein